MRTFTSWAVLFAVAVVGFFAFKAAPVSLSMIRTSSMTPLYYPGDFVVVSEGASFAPGDVVVFTPTSPAFAMPAFAHRVVAIEEGLVLTKGDANPALDDLTTPVDSVSGRVVASVPTRFLAHRAAPIVGGAVLGLVVSLWVYVSLGRRFMTSSQYVGRHRA